MDDAAQSVAAEAEDRHWWFVARRAVLRAILSSLRPATPVPARILEAGCGNGGNLPLLAEFGQVFAFEPSESARRRAQQRGCATVVAGSFPDDIPFADERFDLIAALDVIEHVAEDDRAIARLADRLVPGGALIVAVPAYAWLWSEHDVFSEHYRRYTRGQLTAALAGAGLEIVRATYFNTLLFPLEAAYVTLGRLLRLDPARAMTVPAAPINSMLRAAFAAEARLLPTMNFPVGMSILAVARRVNQRAS